MKAHVLQAAREKAEKEAKEELAYVVARKTASESKEFSNIHEIPKKTISETKVPQGKKSRLNIAIIVALIGFVGTICVALLSSPILSNLFSQTPKTTQTITEHPDIMFTNSAQTVQAQLFPSTIPVMNTSLSIIPTNVATGVSTATSVCDLAQFVKDVTIPDGTLLSPVQTFYKTWRLKNVGTCTWSGYSVVFDQDG